MAIKFNKSAFLTQIAEEKVTEKKTSARTYTRESKINHDEIDLKVYRAILRATARSIKETLNDANRSVRNGILIGDLLTSMEKFSKVEATNRAIVQESIISLQERKLVRSIDGGKFQFINATDGGFYNEIIDRDSSGQQHIVEFSDGKMGIVSRAGMGHLIFWGYVDNLASFPKY